MQNQWASVLVFMALLILPLTVHAQTKGFGVAASAPERRVALVIGNNAYSKIPVLQNAVNDARSMARELKALGFEVLSYENASRKTMKAAMLELEDRVANGGVGIFYYSGHGVAESGGNYLLPVDIAEAVDPRMLQDEAIELNGVMERLSAAKAKFSLMVIDACRDNPFPKKSGRSMGLSRGLAQPAAPEGMIVVYSAGVGQQALDKLGPADRDPNGLFTREFIKEIKKPGVEVAELVRNVGKSVKDKAASISHQQTPAIYIQSVEKFYFIQGRAESSPPRVKSDAEREEEVWDSIKDANSKEALDEYLKGYPNGKFVTQAKILVAKLKSQATPLMPVSLSSGQKPEAVATSTQKPGGSAADDPNLEFLKRFLPDKKDPPAADKKAPPPRATLGVVIQEITADLAESLNLPGNNGALVVRVGAGSPAELAGLRSGDVITRFNGADIAKSPALPPLVGKASPGVPMEMTIVRDGQPHQVQVVLSAPGKVAFSAPPDTAGMEVDTLTEAARNRINFSKSGLQSGDKILRAGNQTVESYADFERALSGTAPGKVIRLLVQRKDAPVFFAIRVRE